MNYYKLINGSNIVGVVSLNDFRRYQNKHGLILFSDIETAQYVEFDGAYYRDNWLRATTTDDVVYESVSIVLIDEEEYNALSEAFETNKEIAVEQEEEIEEEEEVVNEQYESSVDFIRNAKIAQMSRACKNAIIDGVDVVLSDGESHHFSLKLEDQLKIQSLAMNAQNGVEPLFWHEDNKPCRFYSVEDVLTLYKALDSVQNYHTTYFNALKMYLLDLDDIETINGVTYGMEIPEKYQGEIYKYVVERIDDAQE